MIEEIVSYLQSEPTVLLLVLVAACVFGIALYKFFKRKKGYSSRQIQEIEEKARRRL